MVERAVILTALKVLHFVAPVLTATISLLSSLNMDPKHFFRNQMTPRNELCIGSKRQIAYMSTLK